MVSRRSDPIMSARRWRGWIALGLLVLGGARAEAGTGLVEYFRDLSSLRARFEQQVFDETGQPLQSSSGEMVMLRPGRFRWDYRSPYEQLIVADGDRVWIYDKDLEQVSVRSLDGAMGATPLALLSGTTPIDEAFEVSPEPPGGGDLVWYSLTPRNGDVDFSRMRVALRDGLLYSLELEDALGQRTRLTFAGLEHNPEVDPALLRFQPPPGVDVVGNLP